MSRGKALNTAFSKVKALKKLLAKIVPPYSPEESERKAQISNALAEWQEIYRKLRGGLV